MMLVRKLKLIPDDFPNVKLIGINTSLKDYRLAYFINKETGLKFERYDDLPIFDEKFKALRSFSFYSCYDPDQRVHYYLYGNDCQSGKMIEQYSQANYFLLIKGKKSDNDIKTLLGILRKINLVTFVFIPVIAKIKELDGIMQDIELHELSQYQRMSQAL
ncbi:MAG: IPExxxVDY family protein [Omnitrophica WOR_2 bacterium]